MRFRVSAVALAALLSSTVACGGGSSSSSSGGPTPPAGGGGGGGGGGGPFVITITSRNGAQSFTPNPASAGGQMVVFRNADTIPHQVRLNDGSIDTGVIAPGATSAAVQMPGVGTNYHCSLHPDMVGAVGTQAGEPPPPCEGIYCDGTVY